MFEGEIDAGADRGAVAEEEGEFEVEGFDEAAEVLVASPGEDVDRGAHASVCGVDVDVGLDAVAEFFDFIEDAGFLFIGVDGDVADLNGVGVKVFETGDTRIVAAFGCGGLFDADAGAEADHAGVEHELDVAAAVGVD